MILETLVPNKKEVEYSPDLKFINEYEEWHVPNRLYVHWDITTECNFDCSYCYAKRDYQSDWHKTDTWSRQLAIVEALKLRKYPIFLGLLGGEPTMHPRFFKLVDIIHSKLIHDKLDRLYITTNGSTNVIKKIKEYSQTYFLWSLHFEHAEKYGSKYKKFIDNIKISIDKGFTNRVNIMLLPDEKYYSDYYYVFNELKKLDVQLHPHFLYDYENENRKLYNYTDDFFKEFSFLENTYKNYIFETSDSYVRLNDFEIFKHKLNHFKDWKCYNNNYEISYDGKCEKICTTEKVDLTRNILFFKNLKIQDMKCPWNECDCDGFLKIYKSTL